VVGGCFHYKEGVTGMWADVRDPRNFGRLTRLRIRRRRWSCRQRQCDARTWTEACGRLDAKIVVARRSGAKARRRVGEVAHPVWQVAGEFAVCFGTIMNAVDLLEGARWR
jgi:hypothetical protein